MKKILIPTDFSAQAHNAIEYAFNLFSPKESTFVLLNTYRAPHASSGMLINLTKILSDDSKNGLAQEMQWLSDKYPDHAKQCITESVYSEFPAGVNKMVEKHQIDLVVLGTKGLNGWRNWFSSSNSSLISNSNKFPILVVPDHVSISVPKKVVLASDLEPSIKTLLYKSVAGVLKGVVDQFTLLHVNKPTASLSEDNLKEKEALLSAFEELEPKYDEIASSKVFDGITQYNKNNGVELLIMTARGKSFFEKITNTSNTKEMVMLTNIPLMVLPEKAGES